MLLGVGSPFGADRIAWKVVARVETQLASYGMDPDAVRCVTLDRPGAAILDALRGADGAVVVDALLGGGEAGEIKKISREQLLSEPRALSSHGFGLAEALALGATLGELPAVLTVLGIEVGEEAQWRGDDAAVERLAARVAAELRECAERSVRT